MRIRLEIVAHVPDGTTEAAVRHVFHDAMNLYSKSALLHLALGDSLIARQLETKRDVLTMTEITVLDDLANV
jgi:hypothetical protein